MDGRPCACLSGAGCPRAHPDLSRPVLPGHEGGKVGMRKVVFDRCGKWFMCHSWTCCCGVSGSSGSIWASSTISSVTNWQDTTCSSFLSSCKSVWNFAETAFPRVWFVIKGKSVFFPFKSKTNCRRLTSNTCLVSPRQSLWPLVISFFHLKKVVDLGFQFAHWWFNLAVCLSEFVIDLIFGSQKTIHTHSSAMFKNFFQTPVELRHCSSRGFTSGFPVTWCRKINSIYFCDLQNVWLLPLVSNHPQNWRGRLDDGRNIFKITRTSLVAIMKPFFKITWMTEHLFRRGKNVTWLFRSLSLGVTDTLDQTQTFTYSLSHIHAHTHTRTLAFIFWSLFILLIRNRTKMFRDTEKLSMWHNRN